MFHVRGLVNVNTTLPGQETGTSPAGITSYGLFSRLFEGVLLSRNGIELMKLVCLKPS